MEEKFPACFVAEFDLKNADRLKKDLEEKGFIFSTPQFTIFQAQKKGISLTLYQSGKITVQGKEKHDFLTFFLEPEYLGKLCYSYPTADVSMEARVGVDEAGKGDYFGPLCIGGLYVSGEADIAALIKMGVKDSKQLSDKTILILAGKIKSKFKHAIIRIFPNRYNELYSTFKNLNDLLAWGHSKAIEQLVHENSCKKVIIDQFASPSVVIQALKRKKIEVELEQRHRGESDPVVAGASILARAAFVEGMEELEKKHDLLLPKGASAAVKLAAKKAVAKYGNIILQEIAKMHFKTTLEVINMEEDA